VKDGILRGSTRAQASDLLPGLSDDGSVAAGCVLLMQHKMALAYWSLPLLLPFVGAEIKAVATSSPEWWRDERAAQRMHSATRALLLVIADNYTAWNHRKRLVQNAGYCRLAEIRLVDLVQSKHHKSQETWAHRRWLVAPLLQPKSAGKNGPSSGCVDGDSSIIEWELEATARAATMYSKNYNAWTHRIWVALHLPPQRLSGLTQTCRQHCRVNVSDIAAQHFRCVVAHLHVRCVLARDSALGGVSATREDVSAVAEAQELVGSELHVSEELIASFPGHESLWITLRCLFDLSLVVGRAGGELGGRPSCAVDGYDNVATSDECVPGALRGPEVEAEVELWLEVLQATAAAGGILGDAAAGLEGAAACSSGRMAPVRPSESGPVLREPRFVGGRDCSGTRGGEGKGASASSWVARTLVR